MNLNYSNYPASSTTSLPPLELDDAAFLQPALLKKPKGPSACDACRKRKVRCDKQYPCSTCLARGLACKYELVEAAAAAASMPPSLRCLPAAPRYIFAPDNSLKYMPAISFPNSTSSNKSSRRPAGNTASKPSPFGPQCTSDSATVAKLASGSGVRDLPSFPSMPTMRGSNYTSSTSLSSLGPLPPLTHSYSHSSLNPTLQPNVRSGSWSQVESALPPLNASTSFGNYEQPNSRLARMSSHSGLSSLSSAHPTSSFSELDLPPLSALARPGSPNRGLKRSSSTTSISSLSDWNSSSKTPSLSLDGSRRSTSSDLDDHFSMPSTAGSFGLQTPHNSTGSRTSSTRSPMFGYEAAASSHASPYAAHAPSRNTSLDPLQGLNVLGSTRSTNGFRLLSSETYPSLTSYTPGYSSETGALGALPPFSGDPYMSGFSGSSTSHSNGYPGLSTTGGRLSSVAAPYGNQNTLSPYLQSPPSREALARGQGRRLGRNPSYSGLSSYEASGR